MRTFRKMQPQRMQRRMQCRMQRKMQRILCWWMQWRMFRYGFALKRAIPFRLDAFCHILDDVRKCLVNVKYKIQIFSSMTYLARLYIVVAYTLIYSGDTVRIYGQDLRIGFGLVVQSS